jgi:hypothetical protein
MTGFRIKVEHVVPIIAVAIGFALPAKPLAAQDTRANEIMGTWILDQEKSDDARRKYQEAVEPDGGASRSRGGAGSILGGRGGVRGRGGMEGPPPAFVNDWINAVSRITLERADGTVTLTREGREPVTLVADGRERAIETEDVAEPILRKARWDGRDLIVETKLGNSVKIEEKFQLREDGGQQELRVETKINGDRVARDIKFRRVYARDPGEATSQSY